MGIYLSQYEYTMGYRSTKDHGNVDTLSRLPVGGDEDFNREKERADVSVVCNVRELSRQLNPVKPKLIAQETAKGPSYLQIAMLHQRVVAKQTSMR